MKVQYENDPFKNTEWPVTVNFNNEVVGYMSADGIITFTNKDAEQRMMDSTQVPCFVSSRAIGNLDGDIVSDVKLTSCEITEINKDN